MNVTGMLQDNIAAAEGMIARATEEGYTPEIFEAMRQCMASLIADVKRPQGGGGPMEGRKQPSGPVPQQPGDPISLDHRADPEPQDTTDELQDVQRLLGSISSSLALEDVLRSLMDLSKNVIDYKGCGVFLVNEDTAGLDTAASRSFSKGFEAKVRAQWDEGIIDWVMDTGKPIIVPDLETMMGAADLALPMSFVISPLVVEGKKVGVLVLYCDRSRDTFTDYEIDLVGVLSNQAAIAVANAYLYQNLQETHRELKASQAQLVQSAKLAAVGELASGMAHEINNPLQIILGRIALLGIRTGGLDDKIAEDLKIVDDNIMRISEIARRLLNFAAQRSEESEAEPLHLNEVIRQVHDLVEHQLSIHRVQLVFEEGADLPEIRGNATEIGEVFLNLVLNAQHAMPEGGVLTVATQERDGFVEATFEDTGVGIPEEHLDRIFEPFFTTKEEGKGTGLGLSVCYGIVRKHGGVIEVESQVGRGSTFTARFPVQRAPLSAARSTQVM